MPATFLSQAEIIVILLTGLLALHSHHRPFSKQQPEGSLVTSCPLSAQSPLLSLREKARVLALVCKAPILSPSFPPSLSVAHSSHTCPLAVSKTQSHLRTFAPVAPSLQNALPPDI